MVLAKVREGDRQRRKNQILGRTREYGWEKPRF